MSDHDPLCRRERITEIFILGGCPECALIARVRADERKAARDVVEGWLWDEDFTPANVLAAIDGITP